MSNVNTKLVVIYYNKSIGFVFCTKKKKYKLVWNKFKINLYRKEKTKSKMKYIIFYNINKQ